jgi:hypothetical protein
MDMPGEDLVLVLLECLSTLLTSARCRKRNVGVERCNMLRVAVTEDGVEPSLESESHVNNNHKQQFHQIVVLLV